MILTKENMAAIKGALHGAIIPGIILMVIQGTSGTLSRFGLLLPVLWIVLAGLVYLIEGDRKKEAKEAFELFGSMFMLGLLMIQAIGLLEGSL